jgi:hypothetical protein
MKKRISEVKTLPVLKSSFPTIKKPMAPTLKAMAKKSPRWVAIDYPRPSQKVQKGHYAIRVHAPWAAEAQIALNGTLWQNCRSDVGFFWYDWHPKNAGPQKINARARNGAGAWTKADERECEVE